MAWACPSPGWRCNLPTSCAATGPKFWDFFRALGHPKVAVIWRSVVRELYTSCCCAFFFFLATPELPKGRAQFVLRDPDSLGRSSYGEGHANLKALGIQKWESVGASLVGQGPRLNLDSRILKEILANSKLSIAKTDSQLYFTDLRPPFKRNC